MSASRQGLMGKNGMAAGARSGAGASPSDFTMSASRPASRSLGAPGGSQYGDAGQLETAAASSTSATTVPVPAAPGRATAKARETVRKTNARSEGLRYP